MSHSLFRRALAAFMAALVAGFVGPLTPRAQAAEPQPILVIPYANLGDVPEELGPKTAELVATELKSGEAVKVVDVPGLAAPTPEKEEPAAAPEDPAAERDIQEARELVEEGKADLGRGKFKQASESLRKAVAKYKARNASLGDFGELTGALVELAAVHYRLGAEDEGEAILADVVRLDPGKTLDPQLYPPLFLRIFAGIQKKTLGRARGSMKIVSRPAGGRVIIDGRDIGSAPIIVKDLVEGEHYVRVIKDGTKPFEKAVKVAASKVVDVEADLTEGSELAGPVGEVVTLLAKNTITKEVVAKLKAACTQAGAKFAVFGATYDDGPNYGVASYLFNASTGAVAQLMLLTFDPDLLGASIEVYKLGNEIPPKLLQFPASLKLPTPLAMVVQAAEGAAKVAEVSAGVEAPVQAVVPPPVRGPVKSAAAEPPRPREPVKRAPLVPVVPVEPDQPELPDIAAHDAPPEDIDDADAPRRGPVAPAPKAKFVARAPAAPAADGEEGDLAVTGKHEEGDEEEPRPIKRRQITALEPEQIVIPKDEIRPGSDDDSIPWWVWGAIGVVVAGGAGTGIYFMTAGGEPPSATATITWSP